MTKSFQNYVFRAKAFIDATSYLHRNGSPAVAQCHDTRCRRIRHGAGRVVSSTGKSGPRTFATVAAF